MVEDTLPIEADVVTEQTSQNISQEIIKNSIRNAICIDDAYVAPYTIPEEGQNFEDPRKLFYSFKKEGHCDLDIYKYTDRQEWSKHKYLLQNKDLLIQDWELNTSPGPGETKFDNTLPILKDIFENNIIPFVVIYTNRDDLSEVSRELLTKFNAYNTVDFELLIAEFKDKFKNLSSNCEEIQDYFEEDEQSQAFHEYIMFPNKRCDIQVEILNSFRDLLDFDDPENKKTIKKIISGMKGFGVIESIEEAILLLSHICLAKEREEHDLTLQNIRVNIDRLCYSINGTIVLLIHKGDLNDGVTADKLFGAFSQSITNNPHSIINLVSIELKDKFREDFTRIGTRFNTINESAFLYHAKKNYQETDTTGKSVFQEASFKDFVTRSWIHELLQKNLDLNLGSFGLIEEKINEHTFESGDKLEYSLASYASMVSCIKLNNRTNIKLGFGDIFKSGDNYFLCITPLCDCFTPNKINNEFYFIKNIEQKPKLGTALENAEKGFYSFITINNNPEAIEWACKPFTSYIPDDMNDSNHKTIMYSGVSYELEFVCSLKENYAQRISNNSFGQGYRVGIDLPKL